MNQRSAMENKYSVIISPNQMFSIEILQVLGHRSQGQVLPHQTELDMMLNSEAEAHKCLALVPL